MKTLLQNKFAVLTAVFSFLILILPSCTINYPPGTSFQPYQNRFQRPPMQCGGPQYGGPQYGGPQFRYPERNARQVFVTSGQVNPGGGGFTIGVQGNSFEPPIPLMRVNRSAQDKEDFMPFAEKLAEAFSSRT